MTDPSHDPQYGLDQYSSEAVEQTLQARGIDIRTLSDPQAFGRIFFDNLYRILKVASIYAIDHNQTRLAVQEFHSFFREAMLRSTDDSFAVLIRDELAIVNGVTLRLDRQAQKRHNELRDQFSLAAIRGIELHRGMSVDEFMHFLTQMQTASSTQGEMTHVSLPHITLAHGKPIRSIIEAVSRVNKSMYVAHIYIRGLVKVQNMHDRVRERQDADVPMGVAKRILQTVSELLGDDNYTILGLLPMRLVPPSISSHSFNSAIYAMLIADRLGLSGQMATQVGTAVLYQDIDRLTGVAVGHRDRETLLDLGNQFNANLRDSARMLSRLRGDVISTLRVLMVYERGCPFGDDLGRPFYRGSRNLHLITRIVDICRTYDLLIQGLDGYKARRPDLAIQYLESRAGEAFDSALVDLFISTMGIYPVGSTVELSTGERAMVIRTPSPAADPRRPVIKMLSGHSDLVIDLCEERYRHIEILRTIESEEQDYASSRVFLLT